MSVFITQLPPWISAPSSPESVQAYAVACMRVLLPGDWRFGWDRAVRRLGCCRYCSRTITLSRHFVARFCEEEPQLICRTVLHEIAHALAYIHHKETGHRRYWKHYCNLLGIAGEKARCQCADFAPPARRTPVYRYALCHRDTGEVFYRYQRRPRLTARKLKQTYIIGRKDETMGNLCIVELLSKKN